MVFKTVQSGRAEDGNGRVKKLMSLFRRHNDRRTTVMAVCLASKAD